MSPPAARDALAGRVRAVRETGAPPAAPPAWVEPERMRRALELAERGWGRVAPNPLVGAVLVRDGVVVGEGWHAEWGGEHAEAAALRAAGERAQGATLYVGLEPCAHHGKTPPCTEAILAAGVRRVAIGCRDGHPEARGGAGRLRGSGVEVAEGVEGERARLLNAAFLWHQATGRPFVALKLGLSLDGRIAARPGEPTRVTGEEAWEAVHRWRAGFDAILIGIGTAEADDPRLTARGSVRPRVPAVRVALDPSLRLRPGSALAATAREVPTWVVCAPGADRERRAGLEARGVTVVEAEAEGGRPRPASVLDALGRRGIRSVLVEGGARVGSAFLDAGAVQRLYLLLAPRFLGPGGVRAFEGLAPSPPGAWRIGEIAALGSDALVRLESAELLGRLAEAG